MLLLGLAVCSILWRIVRVGRRLSECEVRLVVGNTSRTFNTVIVYERINWCAAGWNTKCFWKPGKAGARRSAAGVLQLVIKARATVGKAALSGSHGSQIQRSGHVVKKWK